MYTAIISHLFEMVKRLGYKSNMCRNWLMSGGFVLMYADANVIEDWKMKDEFNA